MVTPIGHSWNLLQESFHFQKFIGIWNGILNKPPPILFFGLGIRKNFLNQLVLKGIYHFNSLKEESLLGSLSA